MAENYGPYLTGAGANFSEQQWRELFGNLFTPGVLKGAKVNGSAGGDLAATAPGGAMTVNIAIGVALVYGFWYENDTTAAKTISASDPTNDRIDYIVLQMLFASRTVLTTVKAGTPSGSPVPPTLTQTAATWEVPLVQVRVPHGATGIVSGNLTDARVYCGVLPPASQGTGSGLDSDTVDGINASAFVLGNAASQHIIVLNRAPTNSDGVDGDLIFQW